MPIGKAAILVGTLAGKAQTRRCIIFFISFFIFLYKRGTDTDGMGERTGSKF